MLVDVGVCRSEYQFGRMCVGCVWGGGIYLRVGGMRDGFYCCIFLHFILSYLLKHFGLNRRLYEKCLIRFDFI